MTTPALRNQWILVGAACGVCVALAVAEEIAFPVESDRGKMTPLSLVSGIVGAFAHAGWISMDRRRRGLEVGWWRFGAILFGPLALSLYFLLEYRLKGLLLILLMLAVYAATGLLAFGILFGVYAARG